MHKKTATAAALALVAVGVAAGTGIATGAGSAAAAPATPIPTLTLPSLPIAIPGLTPTAPTQNPTAPSQNPTAPSQNPTAPTPPGQAAPTPAPAKVNGDQVDVIGDSITERANVAGSWNRELPGVRVDGVVGRQFTAGIPAVTAMAADQRLRPVVVIALGTNGPVTQADMDAALAAVGDRKVVLVNVGTTAQHVTWRNQVNELIAKTQAAHRDQVVVADWAQRVQGTPGMLEMDGVHPSAPTGIDAWVATVVEAVNGTAALTPTR